MKEDKKVSDWNRLEFDKLCQVSGGKGAYGDIYGKAALFALNYLKGMKDIGWSMEKAIEFMGTDDPDFIRFVKDHWDYLHYNGLQLQNLLLSEGLYDY